MSLNTEKQEAMKPKDSFLIVLFEKLGSVKEGISKTSAHCKTKCKKM